MSDAKITAQCECGNVFRLSTKYAGKTVKCPNCDGPVPIRGNLQQSPREPGYQDDDWDDEDDWEQPATGKPARAVRSKQTRPSKGRSRVSLILMCVGGGLFLLFAVCAGLVYVGFGKLKDANIYANQPEFGDPNGLFPVDAYPVPSFQNSKATAPKFVGAEATVRLVRFFVNEENAGFGMRLRVYMPGGSHDPGSLPCVLVPPAGTNLMVGSQIDEADYHDETLPYVEAGMIAVTYTLDGPLLNNDNQELREAYLKFRAAAGGVVNGRNALEYVLAKVPEVDPNRIYSAGHSSAANVSLLLAAHEPRIAACIAFAPAADVETEMAEIINDSASNLLLPKLADFLKQSNPMTHAGRIKCPVFLFHSRDDDTTPFNNTQRFSEKLKAAGAEVTFSTVDRGGHYQPMIDEGIRLGVQWLKSLP